MSKIFKIVKDSNPSLREKSVNLDLPLDKEIEDLGFEMLEYLKLSQDEEFLKKHPEVRSGVGLAAPQIGKNIKLIAVYFFDGKKDIELVLVNPKIIAESAQKCYLSSGEGCLSVDRATTGITPRHYRIMVKGYFYDFINKKLQFKTMELSGYPAIVFQHEYDHLDGILFTDKLYDTLDNAFPLYEEENIDEE